jgi:hypothetical protein
MCLGMRMPGAMARSLLLGHLRYCVLVNSDNEGEKKRIEEQPLTVTNDLA